MSVDPQELVGALNRVAITSGLDAVGAANKWAGTQGLDLLGALNAKAGTKGLDIRKVCNVIGGTNDVDPVLALASIAIGGSGTPDTVTDQVRDIV